MRGARRRGRRRPTTRRSATRRSSASPATIDPQLTPPRSHRFVQVDVFTDRVFDGNPLGAYLVLDGLVRKSAEVRIVSEQGTKMGRRSFLHIRLAMQGETITEIRVEGGVVPGLEGEVRI